MTTRHRAGAGADTAPFQARENSWRQNLCFAYPLKMSQPKWDYPNLNANYCRGTGGDTSLEGPRPQCFLPHTHYSRSPCHGDGGQCTCLMCLGLGQQESREYFHETSGPLSHLQMQRLLRMGPPSHVMGSATDVQGVTDSSAGAAAAAVAALPHHDRVPPFHIQPLQEQIATTFNLTMVP
jgi:hypothetical protein